MAACFWAYPKSSSPPGVPETCEQSWASSRWGERRGVGPALPTPPCLPASVEEGLLPLCPSTRGKPRRLWIRSCAPVFCASVARLIWSALFPSAAVKICRQLFHRVVALSSSSPCPPPPYRHPSTFPCSIALNETVWIFHIYLVVVFFFFFSLLFCLLVTAFGISRTARTP